MTGNTDLDLRQHIAAQPLDALLAEACALRDAGHGRVQTYSPKVFLPLTQACRNLCHYCTFTQPPKKGQAVYMMPEEVLNVARAGEEAGCTEALLTLGDKPELRFAAAAEELERLGYTDTVDYLTAMARLVSEETTLIPHINAGIMTGDEMARLREFSASQGLMLETVADRLSEKGGPHYRSPDKVPARRLAMLREAGERAIPFTTGILIGIGETREERLDALFAIRDLHREFGHIQEVIVQNFRAKPRTVMAGAEEPSLEDLLWSIAAARLVLGPEMNIQAPPNLSSASFARLIDAGINDWGGVSPVTRDFVNPEAPWPHIDLLRKATAEKGRILTARLPAYPGYLAGKWQDASIAAKLAQLSDTRGFGRHCDWSPGLDIEVPELPRPMLSKTDPAVSRAIAQAADGRRLDHPDLARLFRATDIDFEAVQEAADGLRRDVNGETVSYVVNRNINYTNICAYSCSFCAFSKGARKGEDRDPAYDLQYEEIARRVVEAQARGATEVCLQGGIHPRFTGETYLSILRTVREAAPDIHVHAFSPLEIQQGARTLGLGLRDYLAQLKEAGLGSLPGTAAEILDDDVRAVICADKLTTGEWLEVVGTAHEIGLPTTATMMFGHVENTGHWATHLLAIRDQQERTGGFTEFVPLPFVHMEAPMGRMGISRRGPTFMETVLVHAASRLALHGAIGNIQASWVKLGARGVAACLDAGVNDLGGTLMNESISRAAGTSHGQEMGPERMEQLIGDCGRTPRQRTTLYRPVDTEIAARGRQAAPLAPLVLDAPRRKHEMA